MTAAFLPSAAAARRRGAALVLVCAALVPLSAGARIAVTDDTGREVALARAATRVVSLAPHLTEQLFAIGAGQVVVGTTEHADHPPAARAIPRVARAHSIDLERIAALQPDLIVVWGSGFPPPLIESLRRLRVPVYVDEPGRLDDIAASMLRLGVLVSAPQAPQAAQALRARFAALRLRYANRPPLRVFYQVWSQPLMTLSGRHVVSEALALCGGANVFESLPVLAAPIALEAVLAADPQVIVTAEPGGKERGALDLWRRFPQLAAVRAGAWVTLDADRINRHSPRIADEIEVLCEALDAHRTGR